jgi:diaminopimelate epimerase
MQIQFTKMHGLGNDFMIVRWPANVAGPSPELVRAWADRRTGVGFDSLLLIQEASAAQAVARYRVINADGFDARQCGNGVRCIATYLAARAGESLTLESAAGDIEAHVLGDGMASVNLGEPRFAPAAVPYLADEEALRYRLNLSCGDVEFGIASMGNPHAVIAVDSVDTAPVGILGPEMGRHSRFPEGVNVGFMEVRDEGAIRLRVFERGVGETLACGTGAAAAVAVGQRWGLLGSRVTVELPGGTLRVEWQGPGSDLWQTGPTTKVYEGRIEI